MRCKSILTLVALALSAAPAMADSYPVSGRYGVTASSEKGPVDCSTLRVIAFNGNQRTDSKGGVPTYRNVSVTASGADWRIVDIFTTGQISNARVNYTLKKADADRIELNMQPGGLLKLHRCK